MPPAAAHCGHGHLHFARLHIQTCRKQFFERQNAQGFPYPQAGSIVSWPQARQTAACGTDFSRMSIPLSPSSAA